MASPKPLPTERKRLLGNPGKRRLPSQNVVALAPASLPASMVAGDTPGDVLVRELMAGPAAAWIADPDRVATLELLRDGWNERARLRAAVDDLPPEWVMGRYMPAVLTRLGQLEKELTGWLSLLGLTPSDRSRLGVAEVKARSRLDALQDRRASRSRAG